MKNRNLLASLAGWLVASVATDAQTAVAPPKDGAVLLSPFTVTSEADQGYAARETLAGTRFKSELKDVSAQVSVMTKEFLEDNPRALQHAPFPSMTYSTRRHFIRTSAAAALGSIAWPGRVLASGETVLPPHLKAFKGAYLKNPRQASLDWFRDAKFGLFIHYGLFSLDGIHPFEQLRLKIPVAEYEKKAARFTAEKFDVGALCDLAVEVGMKYVTLVAKHCDGFCLWDTKLSPFNSVRSAARRDFVAEMVKACNERGLGFFAFYEFGFEWHHPHGPRKKDFPHPLTEVAYPSPEPTYAHGADYDLNRYIDYAHAQVEELLTRYGPIAGIWLDGVAAPLSGDRSRFRCQELYDKIHRLQPHALVSFKHGVTGTEDFYAPERFQLQHLKPGATKPAELCESLNPAWGWVKGEKHMDADWVMPRLGFTRHHGMNYLLNIGPMPDGSVLPADLATVKEVGRRIRENGWPKGPDKLPDSE